MDITSSLDKTRLTVRPVGRVNAVTGDDLEAFLAENFTGEVTELVLDFEEVEYISSKGLRVLVSLHKNLNGRSMRIVNANSTVVEVLRLSGLNQLFGV